MLWGCGGAQWVEHLPSTQEAPDSIPPHHPPQEETGCLMVQDCDPSTWEAGGLTPASRVCSQPRQHNKTPVQNPLIKERKQEGNIILDKKKRSDFQELPCFRAIKMPEMIKKELVNGRHRCSLWSETDLDMTLEYTCQSRAEAGLRMASSHQTIAVRIAGHGARPPIPDYSKRPEADSRKGCVCLT